MANIIPRRKVVPLEARRVQVPPMAIDPQTAPPQPPSQMPAQPHVTQNIVYVQVPAPQAQPYYQAPPPPPAPPPADAGPREVHYHTTNVYHSLTRPKLGKGNSFLGSIGVVLGGFAIAAAFVPQLSSLVEPVAIAAAAFAGLGWLLATVFRHAYTGIPLFGLILAGAAYGLHLKNTGLLPKELPKIEFNTAAQPTQK